MYTCWPIVILIAYVPHGIPAGICILISELPLVTRIDFYVCPMSYFFLRICQTKTEEKNNTFKCLNGLYRTSKNRIQGH